MKAGRDFFHFQKTTKFYEKASLLFLSFTPSLALAKVQQHISVSAQNATQSSSSESKDTKTRTNSISHKAKSIWKSSGHVYQANSNLSSGTDDSGAFYKKGDLSIGMRRMRGRVTTNQYLAIKYKSLRSDYLGVGFKEQLENDQERSARTPGISRDSETETTTLEYIATHQLIYQTTEKLTLESNLILGNETIETDSPATDEDSSNQSEPNKRYGSLTFKETFKLSRGISLVGETSGKITHLSGVQNQADVKSQTIGQSLATLYKWTPRFSLGPMLTYASTDSYLDNEKIGNTAMSTVTLVFDWRVTQNDQFKGVFGWKQTNVDFQANEKKSSESMVRRFELKHDIGSGAVTLIGEQNTEDADAISIIDGDIVLTLKENYAIGYKWKVSTQTAFEILASQYTNVPIENDKTEKNSGQVFSVGFVPRIKANDFGAETNTINLKYSRSYAQEKGEKRERDELKISLSTVF